MAKDDPRVVAYGTVDELNSMLGWCRVVCNGVISERIQDIQKTLFDLCAELATPPLAGHGSCYAVVSMDHCHRLENWIDEAQAAIEPMTHFVLPGGVEVACRLDMARACCRRVERHIVTLHRLSPVREELIIYLNRLSDLLYIWSRLVNCQAGHPEITWGSQHMTPESIPEVRADNKARLSVFERVMVTIVVVTLLTTCLLISAPHGTKTGYRNWGVDSVLMNITDLLNFNFRYPTSSGTEIKWLTHGLGTAAAVLAATIMWFARSRASRSGEFEPAEEAAPLARTTGDPRRSRWPRLPWCC